jgi:farnesyl diphosphate synthase
MAEKFDDFTIRVQQELDNFFEQILGDYSNYLHLTLYESIAYSLINAGKRLRPLLLISLAENYQLRFDYALRMAASIEAIHCFSLIHDDLPALDNDDMRRGKPSNHKHFNEGTAILAGDALNNLAFEILANEKTHHDAEIRCKLIYHLAQTVGSKGMIGGQEIDLHAKITTAAEMQFMHYMKTGKMFEICGQFIELACGVDGLAELTKNIGIIYQLIDDLEDYVNKPQEPNNMVRLIGEKQVKNNIENLQQQTEQLIKKLQLQNSLFAQLYCKIIA